MRAEIVAAALLIVAATDAFAPLTGTDGQTKRVVTPIHTTLKSLRDRNRPLLVFAETDKDQRFLQQVKVLGNASTGLQDRQAVLVPLIYKTESRSEIGLKRLSFAAFSEREASKARLRFGIAPQEFAVILIGKDGGEKFRTHTPVTMERLNAVIDAMPMRQQEVRDGNTK